MAAGPEKFTPSKHARQELREATQKARAVTNEITERFQNHSRYTKKRLFTESLLIFLKNK